MNVTLVEALVGLAGLRLASQPAATVYQAVADGAVDLVDGAAAVTLTLGRLEDLQVVAHAGTPDCRPFDQVVGPSRQAIASGTSVHARGDLSPWPRLASAAVVAGVRDVIAQPFDLGADRYGSLTFFATAGLLDGGDVVVADVFSTHAAGVIANAAAFDELRRVNEQLTAGIRSRETVGLAKGILMRQDCCSEAEAFRLLVAASQRANRKVRDVARDLVALTEGRAGLARGPAE